MPRDISPELAAHLAGGVTTLALLFRVVRADDQVFGFTSAEKPISYDGTDYLPNEGMASSDIDSTVGSGIDSLSVHSLLIASGEITEADVRAGLWENARIEVRLVNRRDLTMGDILLFAGQIGETKVVPGQVVEAEVRGLAQSLKQSIIVKTSKTCRCRRLGDSCCKKALGGNTVGGTPIQATRTLYSGAGTSLTFASDSAPNGHYRYGIVKFTSGPNTGIEREVKTHVLTSGRAVLTMRTAFPFAVTPGETAILTAGCDKTLGTCRAKFANANNFHGEADLPGNDQVVRIGRAPRD